MKTDSVRLFIDAWKQTSRGLPSPRFEEAEGVAYCFGDVPNLLFNLWIQEQPTTTTNQLETLLAAAKGKAATSNNPVGGVLREDWLPTGWEELASKYGYELMLPMTSMEAEDLTPPRRAPATLDIVRIADDAGARDLAALMLQPTKCLQTHSSVSRGARSGPRIATRTSVMSTGSRSRLPWLFPLIGPSISRSSRPRLANNAKDTQRPSCGTL